MTATTQNTQAINSNIMLSMSSNSFAIKESENNSFFSYAVIPKGWSTKSSAKFTSIDWDLNMNELEFE